MVTLSKIWRLWAKALGEKAGDDDKEANIIAGIRTFIFITYFITNVAIVSNAVRHWNNINNDISSPPKHCWQNPTMCAIIRGS